MKLEILTTFMGRTDRTETVEVIGETKWGFGSTDEVDAYTVRVVRSTVRSRKGKVLTIPVVPSINETRRVV